MRFLEMLSAVLALLTTICFAYQFFYLFLPLLGKRKLTKKPELRRYAVLIAARNEEKVLPHLLDSIREQDYPAELITTFVIADNCTDRTADVAAEHGATVFTRSNKSQVGKGYALNYLLDKIRQNFGWDAFDAFLIFDADNLLSRDYIRQINALPSNGYEAFCGYRNTKNFGANWISSSYALWYLHESTHMNRSRMLLGVGCAVNGTGFGFARSLLERLGGWNFFTLTEDIEFNNWCACNGVKIGYCHEAVLFDEQPLTFRQSWNQRIRWAQGGIQVSFKYVGRILKGLFKGGWSSYSCYELFSLSLWGFGIATLTGCLSVLLSVMYGQGAGLLNAAVFGFGGGYLSMFFMGAWTMMLEYQQVRATQKQKIGALFTFPLFMMTFVLTTVAAMFRKFEWTPIEHTVAISVEELVP